VLYEKDRDVIAHEVPAAGPGIELDGEASNIAGQVRGPLIARDGGEPHKGRGASSGFVERVSCCEIRQRFIVLEITVGPETPGMYYPLGDALVVEMEAGEPRRLGLGERSGRRTVPRGLG
jgi:hypothetical protein